MLRVNEDMRLNTQLSKYWRRLSIACLRLRIFKKLPTTLPSLDLGDTEWELGYTSVHAV